MSADLYATLNARAKTHGDYTDNSGVAQRMKRIMRATPNWDRLPPYQAESLEFIASKIARILCGDHTEPDHFSDIAGYAELSAARTKGAPE